MTEASQAQLDRLARAVNERMAELRGRTNEEVYDNGGPSTTTISNVRNATGPTPRRDSLDKLDAGLEWERGSAFDLLWHGTPPRPLGSGLPQPSAGQQDSLVELLREIGKGLNDARQGLDHACKGIDQAIQSLGG